MDEVVVARVHLPDLAIASEFSCEVEDRFKGMRGDIVRNSFGPSLMYSWLALLALKYQPSPLLPENLLVGKERPDLCNAVGGLVNRNSVGPEPPFWLLRLRKIHMSLPPSCALLFRQYE